MKRNNIRVRGISGELIKIKLEDRDSEGNYYSVRIKKDHEEVDFYVVEINEIEWIR